MNWELIIGGFQFLFIVSVATKVLYTRYGKSPRPADAENSMDIN